MEVRVNPVFGMCCTVLSTIQFYAFVRVMFADELTIMLADAVLEYLHPISNWFRRAMGITHGFATWNLPARVWIR